MGGSETVDWADALDAAFDAAVAREEEAAAADLAFSLRQDVDVRAAIERSGCGWALIQVDGAHRPVDEVGDDYVRAGTFVARSSTATLRSAPGASPRMSGMSFLEMLGAACREGAHVTIAGASGRLVRVAKDHVAVQKGDAETIVGLETVKSVRLDENAGYSASRGFSG